ncbi:YmaF family protein [Pseudobacillus wudalianchiensis]|uniref:YmaF family protein n=1 Tax=Pseudobacillus wudalianchiensis TaxID=1743143 RepID=UPI00080872D9|nr:YmaF family protein [Bacillus wudalianchiensis]
MYSGGYTEGERHVHEFLGMTSIEIDHTHEYAGTTEPAPSGVPHTHEYITWTHHIDGHRHEIRGRTGPAIPLQGGGHIHYFQGFTTSYPSHYHQFQGATMMSRD